MLIALGGAGYYAYQTGSRIAQQDVISLTAEVSELKEAVGALETRNNELEAALLIERDRGWEWQQRYEADVPTGQRKAYLDLIQKRLDEGMPQERMTFLISTARKERNCDGAPVSKRFLAQSPLYQGANDSVSFADSAVTVTALGESARSATGSPEAWYDPAQPVEVRFTLLGGESVEAKGKLPLHHSVVVNNAEYRFALTAGDRGFINVTADRCDYP